MLFTWLNKRPSPWITIQSTLPCLTHWAPFDTSSQLATPRLKALWLEAGACTLNHRLKAIDTASMLKGLALWIDAHVGATLGSTLGKSQRKDPVEGHNWIRTKPPGSPSSAQ